jgi:restriction endonuclease S subunit
MDTALENKIEELQLDKSKWKLTKFGDFAIQQKGRVDRENTELTRYILGGHMNSEDLHIRNWGNLTDEYLGPAFIRKFEKGDILYGSRRTYLRKVAIADFDGITSNTTFVVKANEDKIDKRLLPFIMMSEGFTENSIKNSKGSVNPYINWKDIAKYEFLLPPKDQQAKLAELLWGMDEVIERENATLNKNEELFLSFSKSIFFEGIGKQTKLKDVGDLIMGQSPPGKTYNKDGNGMPFLQGNAEFGKKHPSHIKYTSAPNRTVKEKTILISVRAPVGDLNIAEREYCIGRGLAGLYIENESLRNYVYNFLKYERF